MESHLKSPEVILTYPEFRSLSDCLQD